MLEILKTLLKECGTIFEIFENEIRIPVNSFTCSNKNLSILSQEKLLNYSELWYQEAIISIQWDEIHQEFNWAIFEAEEEG